MVCMVGFEPTPVWILSPMRLPIALHTHLVSIAGFEPALYSFWNYCLCQLHYMLMVYPENFEISTPELKVLCSASELRIHGYPPRTRTSVFRSKFWRPTTRREGNIWCTHRESNPATRIKSPVLHLQSFGYNGAQYPIWTDDLLLTRQLL